MKGKCGVAVFLYCASSSIITLLGESKSGVPDVRQHDTRRSIQNITFERAKQVCGQYGEDLPSVKSVSDQEGLKHLLLNSKRDETWLDIRRTGLGSWTWVDGTTSGIFGRISEPRCGFLDYTTPNLRYTNCSELWLGYLCQIVASKGCPDFQVGLKQVQAEGNCYTVHMEKVNWFEARHRCRSKKDDLALIKSNVVANILRFKLRTYWGIFRQYQFWIGIRNNEWTYQAGNQDGYVLPAFWAHGEPRDDGQCARAVKLGIRYAWKATPCHQNHLFVCVERPTSNVQTTIPSTVQSTNLEYTTDVNTTIRDECISHPMEGSNKAAIIGGVTGTLLGVLIATVIHVIICLKRKKKKQQSSMVLRKTSRFFQSEEKTDNMQDPQGNSDMLIPLQMIDGSSKAS